MFDNERTCSVHTVSKLSVDYADIRAMGFTHQHSHVLWYTYVTIRMRMTWLIFLGGNDTGTLRKAALRVGIPALVFNAPLGIDFSTHSSTSA